MDRQDFNYLMRNKLNLIVTCIYKYMFRKNYSIYDLDVEVLFNERLTRQTLFII